MSCRRTRGAGQVLSTGTGWASAAQSSGGAGGASFTVSGHF
jgi:hypothetical protein